MDDSFKFSNVTKTLLEILENELPNEYSENESILKVDLENLNEQRKLNDFVEPLK